MSWIRDGVTHPFAAPYAARVRAHLGDGMPDHAAMTRAFADERAASFSDEPELSFVTPERAPPRRRRVRGRVDATASYDGAIVVRRSVPTRPGDLHDFFNFVVWLHLPRTKRALHARQLEARTAWIGADAIRIPGARTPEQDALTLFDEGGSVAWTDPRSGVERFLVFGHAVLEHFVTRDAPINTTTMVLGAGEVDAAEAETDLFRALDHALERRVTNPAHFVRPGLEALYRLHPDGRREWVAPLAQRAGVRAPS